MEQEREKRDPEQGAQQQEFAGPSDWQRAQLIADRIQRGGIRLLRLARQGTILTSRDRRRSIKVAMLAELRLLVKEGRNLEEAMPDLKQPMDRFRQAAAEPGAGMDTLVLQNAPGCAE